ncbi:MAG: hypothetical protein QW046_04265 [Candidatus Micrarchaeaceae archaeon]
MNHAKNVGRRGKWLVLLAAVLIPALATASVAIVYNFNTSTTPHAQEVYLTAGPNYATANAMHLFYVLMTGSSVANGATIYLNGTSNSGTTYLLDVLEVYNASLPKASSITVTVVTTSLPAGVTMYYDTTGSAIYSNPGTTVPSGTAITVTYPTSSGPFLYFSFAITAAASSSGFFTVSYVIS